MISAGLDEHGDRLDQCGGPARAGADTAEHLPGLQLGVGSFTGTTLPGVGGVDLLLVVREPPVAAGVGASGLSRRAGWTGSSARPARRSRSSSVNGWCPGWARTALPAWGRWSASGVPSREREPSCHPSREFAHDAPGRGNPLDSGPDLPPGWPAPLPPNFKLILKVKGRVP